MTMTNEFGSSTVIIPKMIVKPPIWIPLLITTYFYVELETLALSHYDLESANKTCDGKGSCENFGRDVRLLEEINWLDRNCLCDELCAKYGDCCVDSPYFRAAEQRRGAASFTCVDLKQFGGIYMVTTCPSKWKNAHVRKKCEMMETSDPLTTLPVTSHKSGITYRNFQCALCHNDVENGTTEFWIPRLECLSLHPGLLNKTENVTEALTWNETRQQWGVQFETWHACSIDPVIPEVSSYLIRRCRENVIHACAVNWTNTDVRNRCEAYTSLVYDGPKAYRNPHCALCNNIPLQNLGCSKISQREFLHSTFSPSALSVLFDLTGKGAVGKVKPCLDNQLYDPFFKICRDVLCPKTESGKSCIAEEQDDEYYPPILPGRNDDDEKETWNASYAFLNCPKFLLGPEDYEYKDENNKTIYISAYDKYFTENEFKVNEDDSLEICTGTLGQRLVNKFGQYMGYITAIGLGVSIVFLILHLIAFLIVPDLQNLSGKNLASLCVALLLAACSFIAGQGISTGTRSCAASGIITYYGYLASFFWMLTMAFDIWRTLKIATFELRVSSGKQWKKFICYSIWSWTAPLIFTIAAIATDISPSGSVDVYLRPFFGVHSCWFGHRQALLVFFAAPFAVIMIANIGFFASSAHMIFSTTSTTRYTASGSTQRDFRLYIRLALVMGLTWITGLFGGYLDIDALWYTFIALNTLQGLFIFLAFTCNDKVIRAIKELLCTKLDYDVNTSDIKERRPPSYSWSGGSSNSTNKSNLGSSSEDSSKHRAYEANSKIGYDSAPRSKAFEDTLTTEYDPGLRSIKRYDSSLTVPNLSKDLKTNLNAKLAFDSNYRSKSSEILPKINYSSHPELNYGTNTKINPLYGSTKKISRNSSYDRKHLDDTLY